MAGLRCIWMGTAFPAHMDAQEVYDEWKRAEECEVEYLERWWVATGIGDVPRRHAAEQWTPEQLAGWAKAVCAPYAPNRIVPVESLGRDHE